MKKFLLFIFMGIFISMISHAQVAPRKCGTMEHLEMQKALDPSLGPRMELFEQQLQQWIENNQDEINSEKAVITIPVVVHIVYYTADQNISDARVQEQIDVLNRDYAGLNTHSMYSFASSLKTNTELQFCLAKRTPAGAATNGIERRQTTVSTAWSTTDKVKYYSKGGLDAWDPTKYMNIWVCNLGSSLCGYAQFPTSGVNATFGVVINYPFFGLTGATAPYNLGGTTTHEIGHCFNLYHIWGDDGTACTGTDYCSDVPNQAGPNYGVPAFPHVTCSNGPLGDMFMNFMDYTDDVAYANFTPNQKARIQSCFVSGGLLYSLTQSNGCVPPSTTCDVPGGLTAISITSSGATLGWGAVSAATSYNIQYRKSGTTTWTSTTSTTSSKVLTGLTASTNYEFQIQTVCSNGSSAFSASATFTTLAVSTCTDNYESNNTLTAAKSIAVNTDIKAMIGTSTDVDYFKFSNTSTQKKIKVTLTGLPADYDLALYKSNGTRVGISQNSGTTSESIVYNTTSVGTYYIKVYGYNGAYNSSSCYTLKAAISSTNFRKDGVGFEEEPETADYSPLNIYPNPAHNILNVDFNSSSDGNLDFRVFDITGKMVMSGKYASQKGMNTFTLNLSELNKGMYFINVNDGTDNMTRKLVIE